MVILKIYRLKCKFSVLTFIPCREWRLENGRNWWIFNEQQAPGEFAVFCKKFSKSKIYKLEINKLSPDTILFFSLKEILCGLQYWQGLNPDKQFKNLAMQGFSETLNFFKVLCKNKLIIFCFNLNFEGWSTNNNFFNFF